MSEISHSTVTLPTPDRTLSSIVAETFTILSNETRLDILLALWEVSDEDRALSFSELHERVGVRDSGQFNYHLDKLRGSFVRKSGDRYLLRNAGSAIVEAVISGMGFEDPTLEPAETDIECPYCGAPTAVGYKNELFYQVCTECEGEWEDPHTEAVEDEMVEKEGLGGRLFATPFDPAGLSNRTPQEVFEASAVSAISRLVMSMNGVCPSCSGPVEKSLHICEKHSLKSSGVCSTCRNRWKVLPQLACTLCKSMMIPPPSIIVIFHPAVINFYADHGITVGDATDPENLTQFLSLIGTHEVSLISEDPPLVCITIRHEEDELSLIYDTTLNVIDVSR